MRKGTVAPNYPTLERLRTEYDLSTVPELVETFWSDSSGVCHGVSVTVCKAFIQCPQCGNRCKALRPHPGGRGLHCDDCAGRTKLWGNGDE